MKGPPSSSNAKVTVIFFFHFTHIAIKITIAFARFNGSCIAKQGEMLGSLVGGLLLKSGQSSPATIAAAAAAVHPGSISEKTILALLMLMMMMLMLLLLLLLLLQLQILQILQLSPLFFTVLICRSVLENETTITLMSLQ